MFTCLIFGLVACPPASARSDGKFWIQRDGTEESIPVMLMEKGVPKEHIVMAYRHPSDQKLMGFALV